MATPTSRTRQSALGKRHRVVGEVRKKFHYTFTGICSCLYFWGVSIVTVYKCLCDLTRLRILNLLRQGPLCVCHLQDILQEPQVKMSKHLRYLRQHGLIERRRHANWNVYSLPDPPDPLLSENLKCLQDLQAEEPLFKTDSERRLKVDTSAACATKLKPTRR